MQQQQKAANVRIDITDQTSKPQMPPVSIFPSSPESVSEASLSTQRFQSHAKSKQSLFDGHMMPTNKHDTRIVNEAFQDAVQLLEDGFSSKMQAEMLVLVDVLHKPAAIFPPFSIFRKSSQEKFFIAK